MMARGQCCHCLSVFPGGFQCPRRCRVFVHAFVCCLLMRYHFREAVDERARRDDDEDEKSGFSFTVSRWKEEGWLGG